MSDPAAYVVIIKRDGSVGSKFPLVQSATIGRQVSLLWMGRLHEKEAETCILCIWECDCALHCCVLCGDKLSCWKLLLACLSLAVAALYCHGFVCSHAWSVRCDLCLHL